MAGNSSELLCIVHSTSACSPTGHSPKSNFIDGSMFTKTGRAVPANAISTDVSGGKKGNLWHEKLFR